MRTLVTGGAGFIGTHISVQLLAAGHEVVVVDALASDVHPAMPTLPDGVELIVGDVRDVDVWRRAVKGVDAVCHQAARVGLGVDFGDVARYVADNDVGTAAGLLALHETRFAGRLVLASSVVVYGAGLVRCEMHGAQPPAPRAAADLAAGRYEPRCRACGGATSWIAVDEDAPTDTRSVYAATKLHQEHLCFAFGREHAVAVTALRYHNVYGPGMPRDTPYAGVAALFRSAVEREEPPTVLEDGQQMRDFVHVDDVARANVLALESPMPYDGPLNVASGQPRSVLDVASALCTDTTLTPAVVGGTRAGDVRHIVASPSRAEQAVGFRATRTPDVGLRDFRTDPLRPAASAR
jgi:dTDP-L-rhamnose 4-epimerase